MKEVPESEKYRSWIYTPMKKGLSKKEKKTFFEVWSDDQTGLSDFFNLLKHIAKKINEEVKKE